MNIRRSRGVLTRALMQRARATRSAKVISNRYSRVNQSSNTSKSGTSANKTKDSTTVTMYQKVEKAADQIQEYATLLIKLGKTEITSENEKKTDTATETTTQNETTTENATNTKDADTLKKEQELQENIVDAVEELVESFNTVYENLTEIGGTVNTMYATRIKDLMYSNKTKLEEVGITQNKKGKLEIDTKKLNVAGLDKLKEVFCKENGLVGDLKEHAKFLKESAAATASVLSRVAGTSIYNQYGTSSSYINNTGSLYNFLG